MLVMPSADCDLRTIIRYGTWIAHEQLIWNDVIYLRFWHYPTMVACSGENIAGRASEDFKHVEPVLQALLTSVMHLHAAGIVHGDIKPRNIMRTGGVSSNLYR